MSAKNHAETTRLIVERERRALSATWASSANPSSYVPDRRLRATDESLVLLEPPLRAVGSNLITLGHTYNSVGSFRRTARDNQPPRSVVTSLVHPVPPPGWPFPGSSVEAIIAYNAKIIAEQPSPLLELLRGLNR